MHSFPAISVSQPAEPAAERPAQNNLTEGDKLSPIQAHQWESLSSSQRQVQFKAHFDSVQASWNGIARFLEKSVDQATRDLHADPQNKSRHTVLANRNQTLTQVKTYVFDKTAPKMLDLLYLNQTRAHLEEINQQLGNEQIDPEVRLGAAMELAKGLSVCKEGVALNILACAKNLSARTRGHPLKRLYDSARDELINQHMLAAVRMSHARATAKGHRESDKRSHKALEIHEVQALRNALSSELGLQSVPDKYINPDYQEAMGAIARKHLLPLVSTHAVASRVADELLNWIQGTGLLADQVLVVDGKSAIHHAVDISGNQYKDLTTSLQNELGIEAALLFDSPDDDFTKLTLVSPETLTGRLVEWIVSEQGKPGSPIQGLGESQHHPVTTEQINSAMQHFLEPAKHMQDEDISPEVIRSAFREPVRNPALALLWSSTLDHKKQAEKKTQEKRVAKPAPLYNPLVK